MAVLVYSELERKGMIALPPGKVEGEPHPARQYSYDGHIVVLDGRPAHVLAHDAREICKIAGHRLASSQECNAYYRKQGQAGMLTEMQTALNEEEAASIPDDESEIATTSQVLTTETAPTERPRVRRKG